MFILLTITDTFLYYHVVSKIIERALHNHVYSYVTQNCILNVHQSGFRPKYSTETALVDMVDDWLLNINSGQMTGVLLSNRIQ